MDHPATDTEINRIQEASKKIADCVVLFEEAIEKLEKQKRLSQQTLQEDENYFRDHADEIKLAIKELRELMTQTGVARFRTTAERALKNGEEHLQAIQQATENFQNIVEDSCQHINKVADNSAKWIAESIKSLQIEDFRREIFDNVSRVEKASDSATTRVNKMVRWVHWEKFGTALIVAIVVAFLTGLFINDELPWDSHKQVVAQREAGKALIKAWPKLTPQEKAHIQSTVTDYI